MNCGLNVVNGVVVSRDIHETANCYLVRAASTSLQTALECLHDRVILYRPHDRSPGAYVGIATVVDIQSHDLRGSVLLALAEIVWFPQSIGFESQEGLLFEQNLNLDGGGINFHRTAPGLRLLDAHTFLTIVQHAYRAVGMSMPGQPDVLMPPVIDLDEDRLRWERKRIELRQQCLDIYHWRCMVSGRRLDVPGGGSLLQVSHFQSLKLNGPDEIQNTGMMTPLIHGMFEIGLFCILPSRKLEFLPDLPLEMLREFNGKTDVLFPRARKNWPFEIYLEFHRKNVFEPRRLSIR